MEKIWTPERPIKELPFGIKDYYKEHAAFMYHSLKTNKLRVELIDAPMPMHVDHFIRMPSEVNPDWYRKEYERNSFYKTYRSKRTNRKRTYLASKIKRKSTEKALEKIAKEQDRAYHGDLFNHQFYFRDLINDRLVIGYKEGGEEIPPNNIVREYFGLETLNKGINNSEVMDYSVFLKEAEGKKRNGFGNSEDIPF